MVSLNGCSRGCGCGPLESLPQRYLADRFHVLAFLNCSKKPYAESNNYEGQPQANDKERGERWTTLCCIPVRVDVRGGCGHEAEGDTDGGN